MFKYIYKKGGRLVKGSRRVCGLTLICFDIPCSLIICRVSGLAVIYMKCQAESNRPSGLHAHSFTSSPASTRQGPPSPGATPALREHLCGTGYPRVLWAPRSGARWTGLANLACPLWPQGSQNTFLLISASRLCIFTCFSHRVVVHIFCVSHSPLRALECPGCHLTSGFFTSDALVDEERLALTYLMGCWFRVTVLLVCTFQGQAASFTKSLGLFTYGNQHKFTQTIT